MAWRECRVGLLLGVMLAGVGLVVATLLVGAEIALIVALSLVAICAWTATVGATMPLLAKLLRIDPAVVSAPMVTTLVDATGLIIYFLIAQAVPRSRTSSCSSCGGEGPAAGSRPRVRRMAEPTAVAM